MSLKRAKLGNGTKVIGNRVFYDCIDLEEVILPDTLRQIYDEAFWGCTSLEKITLPASVAQIRSNAFRNCSSLKEICFKGTKAQFLDAIRGVWIGLPLKAKVVCSDGEL